MGNFSTKYTIEYVKNELLKYGYEMLDSEYKGALVPIKCKDKDGYIIYTLLNSLKLNYKPTIFGNSNKYTLYNISNYMKINNIPYKLKDGNIFNGAKENLIFICSKHGEFVKSWDVFSRGIMCNECSGNINSMICDANRLSTNRPDLIKYFVNKNEANNYAVKSNKIVNMICPICNTIKEYKISDVSIKGFSCKKCSDGISMPEKYCRSILNQLKINYKPEKIFSWAKNKIYDFWIEDLGVIIETHGGFHYFESNGMSKTLKEEQENDLLKYNLAIKNGINPENYIVVDCHKSDFKLFENNFKNSMSKFFNLDMVDFNKCKIDSLSSTILSVCECWNKIGNAQEIANLLNLSKQTVIRHLKYGSSCGICTYNPKEEMRKSANMSNGYKKVKIVKLDLDFKLLVEYDSLTESDNENNMYHGFTSRICAKNKPYKGFYLMYKSDYNKLIKPNQKQQSQL